MKTAYQLAKEAARDSLFKGGGTEEKRRGIVLLHEHVVALAPTAKAKAAAEGVLSRVKMVWEEDQNEKRG